MADNPPVEADLAGFADDGSAPAGVTEFWRNLWPWDDLNAKSPPGAWQQFQRDVLPVLAALTVVRSPLGPRALAADAAGRLLTSGFALFEDLTKSQAAAGASSWSVVDASIYSVGMLVLIPDFGAGGPGAGRDFIGRINNTVANPVGGLPTITFEPVLPQLVPANTRYLVLGPQHSWLPPAPWVAPNRPPIPFNASILTGATLTLLAGVAGQTIWLFNASMSYDVVGNTGMLLEDSAGNILASWATATLTPGPHSYGGAPLATGLGIRLHNGASTTITVRGFITVSQA